MSSSVYDVPVTKIDGAPTSLKEWAGKVLLVVNVASKCGFTPQYEGLEKLYEAQRERGLVVLGFPANDFLSQEPGTNDEIAAFCTTTYDVQFPLFEKITVKGDAMHPLYREMIAAQPAAAQKPGGDLAERLAKHGIHAEKPSDIFWNFEKFLVSRDGRVVGRFSTEVAPDDPMLLEAIEAELSKTV